MIRGRRKARIVVAGQLMLFAAVLLAPSAAAAATLDFTLQTPSVSTVAYSDLVTFRGTYTCVNDAVTTCPTTALSHTATFALRPSGGSTFTTVTTVTTGFVFTVNPAGCVTTCSVPFQVVWKVGKVGATTIPPGAYDVGLTTTIGAGQPVLPGGLTIVAEDTTTTYSGATSGLGGTPFALQAAVVDLDRGLSAGTGIFSPDVNLAGPGLVTFALYDSTNTNLVVGPVSANLTAGGAVFGSPTLTPPSSGGSFRMRTTFVGNSFYTTSSDLDVIAVTPSNTPPQLVLPASPVVAEATSPSGAAVTFDGSAIDAEDDPDPTPTCDHASGSAFALGDTTVDCSVTDTGGLPATGSLVVRVVDTTDPTVGISTSETAAGSGWYNSASNDGTPGVTIDVTTGDLVGVSALSCTDNGVDVGELDPGGDSFIVLDGSHSIACVVADAAGNTAGATAGFDIDQTAPTITAAVAPDASGTGWWNASTGAPTVSFSCDDATSGVASCSDQVVLGEGLDLGATGTATDVAGNSNAASVTGLDVDLTAPTSITFTGGGLADGGAYPFLFVPEGPTGCTASDALSGVATCRVAGYATDIGSHAVTATVTDAAGNTAVATLTYEVAPWTLVGFSKPIEMTGFNMLKAGNSAQLRFKIFAGSTEVTSPDAIVGLEQQQISCDSGALVGAASAAPKKRNQPNVDAAGGHFSARWESPSLPGTCWLVTVRTLDGSSLSAQFRLR